MNWRNNKQARKILENQDSWLPHFRTLSYLTPGRFTSPHTINPLSPMKNFWRCLSTLAFLYIFAKYCIFSNCNCLGYLKANIRYTTLFSIFIPLSNYPCKNWKKNLGWGPLSGLKQHPSQKNIFFLFKSCAAKMFEW